MRTMTLRGVLTLTILALSVTTSFGQSLLTGNVVDEEMKPVVGAVIKFELKDSKQKRETNTDKKGAYLIVGLPSGDYKITATKGDLIDTATATLKQGKASINFTLHPAGGTPVKATAKKGAPAGLEGAAAGAGTDEKEKDKQKIIALQATATEALQAVKDGKHEEAIPKLNEVIAFMPNCSDCYLYLGMSLFAVNRIEEAEASLKKGVELQPTVEGYTMLVRFYDSQKNTEKALEMSKKASDLAAAAEAGTGASAGAVVTASGSSETIYNQGVVLWNAGKFAEAKPQFEAALKANPKNAEAHYMLGMAQLNLGQIPAARKAFQDYLNVAPNGPKAAEVKNYLTQLPK